MNTQEILKFCLERGFLVDKEVLSLFDETSDAESVKLIIERIKESTNQRIITKNLFNQNRDKVFQIFSMLPNKNQQQLEKLKIKLGLSIEISKEFSTENKTEEKTEKITIQNLNGVKILSAFSNNHTKKLEVGDFTKYFRNRVNEMKRILQGNAALKNLVSINKISANRQGISIIGIVSNKSVTKNRNMLL